MKMRIVFPLLSLGFLSALLISTPAPACCPVGRAGSPVVNADQSVIILWDEANKTQHFIRQANFKSDDDDFGFLIPSPSKPELDESGNEAFPYLMKLTEPEIQRLFRPTGTGCGCGGETRQGFAPPNALPDAKVTVLEEKRVAGFDAVVLEAKSADSLVAWLKEHGYAFSPEVEAWAKPYIDQGWKITALKVAKEKDKKEKTVAAASLRMSFKTEKPLFPYREPDTKSASETLSARNRLLRIYFVADSKYEGQLTKEKAWTGKVAWADKLNPGHRTQILHMLKLPETSGPQDWYLTEFEDNWAYEVAPADVYFAKAADQTTIKRPPIIQYVSAPLPTDVTVYALACAMIVPALWTRFRRGRKEC